MDTEILKLDCPICGREMEYKLEPQQSFGHYIAPDRHWFTCDKDHERVLVSIEDNQLHHTFVYLGDGCYVFGDFDNTSCEKAIGRMKLEYDCDKFMEHFEERNPWAKV